MVRNRYSWVRHAVTHCWTSMTNVSCIHTYTWRTNDDDEVSVVAGEKAQRRGSVGSLDSGMSVSFQSTAASNCSRNEKLGLYAKAKTVNYQQSFLGGLFNKRERHPSRCEEYGPGVKSTEV